jgi:fermentation-respiration switch protein FrsA (DUF1100 family)
MIALWIALGILVLLLIAGWRTFEFACVRKPGPDMTKRENLEHSHYEPIAGEMLAGMAFIREHRPETLTVTSFDGLKLSATFVPHPGARGTLLLFHGYRSSALVDFAISAPFYWAQGFNLLLPDERSHGASEGRYITFGVRERRDVESWVGVMAARLGPEEPLYLGGLSMGAATVLMASEYDFPANVRGIIADCGFTSPYEIQKSVMRGMHKPLPVGLLLLLMDLYTRVFAGYALREASTLDAVAKTKYPILFIHGTGDSFVPCRMSQEAYDACRSEKKLVLVEGAEHAMSYLKDRPRVQAATEAFFDEHLKH